MNLNQKILVFIPVVILILVSCGSRPAIKYQQSVLKTDICKNNENHTYFVYVPNHASDCELMPLVIIIDPHGSGGYAIRHFIETSETYKFILAASNLVRNNFPEYGSAIRELINDIKDQYPVSDNIYLAGFSGGARMVLSFAQEYQVNGVLACGALAGKNQLTSINTIIYALMGRADFNFPEVADFILNESEKPSNLMLQLAGELHQWPSSEDIKQGLGWLYLSNKPADKECISHAGVLKDYAVKGKDQVDSLLKYNLYIQTRMLCQNMICIKDLPDRHYFKEILNSTVNHPALTEEISQLRKSLQFEYKVRAAYYNAFGSKDTLWWKREMNELNSRIETSKELTMQYALKRVRAFLGIVCYSLANNALRINDLNAAAKALAVYRLVEPENADMFYFYALYSLKTGKLNDIPEYIKSALINGFSDTLQIKREFPADALKDILP